MGYRAKIDNDLLIACSPNGIIKKDLATNKPVETYAFNGKKIADFVQKGDSILGLVLPVETINPAWVLSVDGGLSFSDFLTPCFNKESNIIQCLCQHPTNKNIIIAVDDANIWRTKDFGKNWEIVSDCAIRNGKGKAQFHPLDPNIITVQSENWLFNSTIYISRDGGDNWELNYNITEIDNCMHQIAFHPTNKDHWICGGEGIITETKDGGKTWETIYDDFENKNGTAGYFYNTIWDAKTNIIYSLGVQNQSFILASGDGGKTWEKVFECHLPDIFTNDMVEYEDHLVLYSDSGLYLLKKSDILPKSASTPLLKNNGLQYLRINKNHIRFVQPADAVTIFDSEGRVVYRHKQTHEEITLPTGFYIIDFYIGNEQYKQKIVLM